MPLVGQPGGFCDIIKVFISAPLLGLMAVRYGQQVIIQGQDNPITTPSPPSQHKSPSAFQPCCITPTCPPNQRNLAFSKQISMSI